MGKRTYDQLATDSSKRSRSKPAKVGVDIGSFSQSDLDSLSYAVSKLQKSLDIICSVCPQLSELDLDSESLRNNTSRQAQSLLDSRMKLVQQIQRAAKGYPGSAKVPFIEDVLSATGSYSKMWNGSSGISTFNSGRFDSIGNDEVVNSPESQSERSHSSPTESRSPSPSKAWPPPLPPINNPRLLNQVFTHKSAANDQVHLTQFERLHLHNERLEFLGDSILNFTVSEIVYWHFPDAAEGDLSVIRSSLICNDTLWEWATVYGLDKRLETKFEMTTEFEGKRSKIIADVLEAYIGGLYLDSPEGLTLAQGWIEAMVKPIILSLKKEREEVEPLDADAKNLLYVRIGSALCTPEYITIQEGTSETPFTVECRVGNEVIGVGTGPNIKAAGTRAAMMALRNKDVIEKYSELRRSTPRHLSKLNPESANSKEGSGGLLQSSKRPKADKSEIPNPKNDLYSLIGSATQRPIYHTRAKGLNSFISDVCMYDDLLGSGSGRTKKEAEQNAAQKALENEELMTKWAKVRK
jgi:ribonuclease III